jgi:hypothetical protein
MSILAGGLFLLTSGAFAAPPQARLQLRPQAQHLDLRAPSHAVDTGNVAEQSLGTFPSPAHRQSQNSARERADLPGSSSEGMHARPAIQDFVLKVHREGLPVARLFETKSALVHLGLSPRGKPGLWLVQKTR